MTQESPFVPLLIITLLALLVPVFSSRMRIVRLPIVVGEILAGIIIGKSGFDLVQPSTTLKFLGEFGFTFLMFLSGLEVNFETLYAPTRGINKRPRWQNPVPLSTISFLLSLLLSAIFMLGLSAVTLTENPLLIGLILSTSSLGIVMPVLKEHGQTSNTYGQTLIITALISDFTTLLLLSTAIAFLSHGLSPDLLLFMVLLGFFVMMAKISRWANRIPLLAGITEELAHATAQIRVRGAFALMVIWVVLAEALGLEVILGAFLAGAIMSMNRQGKESQLRMKLDAIGYGFFIPIFFITVGAEFDLGSLMASRSSSFLVIALIISAYLIKLLPGLLFSVRFSWRQSIAAGTLLSSRLSLIIAVSAITLELGLISEATNAALIVVAIVTCTFSPFIFSRLLPHKPEAARKGVIILGTDQLATLLGFRLRQTGDSVTYIDRDASELDGLKRDGFTCVSGDPRDENVWDRAGANNARALIAVTRAPKSLLVACQLAQERFGIPTIIARADNPQLVSALQSMNVRVVQPAMAVALALEGALHFPAAFNVLMEKGDNVEVLDVPLQNPVCFGQTLRHLRLPGDALVLGIQRQGEVVVPHGDTVLRRNDLLMLVGSPESLEEGRRWLAG